MDNARLFLFLALAFTGLLLWEAWQKDYGVGAQQRIATDSPVGGAGPVDTPTAAASDSPVASSVSTIDSGADATVIGDLPSGTTDTQGRLIDVHTDTLNLKIDTRGGTIVEATLQKYPVSVAKQDEKFVLLSRRADDYFIAQTGLLGEAQRTPDLDAVYTAAQTKYVLDPESDQLDVDLLWRSADGMEVAKRYRFTRGSHAVRLQHIVKNNSQEQWNGRAFRQFKRGEPSESGNAAFMYTYTGGAIYSQEDKYQKYSFEDLAEGKLDRDVTDGWVSMIQHYFLAAIVPPRDQQEHFYGKQSANGRDVIGSYTPAKNIAPGCERIVSPAQLFLGPKIAGRTGRNSPKVWI